MTVTNLICNARLLGEQLVELRSLINSTRECYIGCPRQRVGDVTFEFFHLESEGDLARIRVLKNDQQVFMGYVDYRKREAPDNMWWIYNVNGEPTMRQFDLYMDGITDQCFQQFIIDALPHLA